MFLSTRNLNFQGFINSKLVKVVCLLLVISLYADEGLTRAELQGRIEQTEPRSADARFYLYKDLLSLQIASYLANGGDLASLASTIRLAITDLDERPKCIDTLNIEEKEIFESYKALLTLASNLVFDAANCNRSFYLLQPLDFNTIHAEPLQLYLLQVLEMEKDLHFPVLGAAFLAKEQTTLLKELLTLLQHEIQAMYIYKMIQNQADLTLKHKELGFYWTTFLSLCHEFLVRLDRHWGDCAYDRLEILNLIFSDQVASIFPYPTHTPNGIDMDPFLPFILKHADLELIRTRFDQANHTAAPWDLNFKWVELHLKAAESLVWSDREKAKIYIEKAEKLTQETLWCSLFSFNKTHWNAKQQQAKQLIHIFECKYSALLEK